MCLEEHEGIDIESSTVMNYCLTLQCTMDEVQASLYIESSVESSRNWFHREF
jgi:hypothetical protein